MMDIKSYIMDEIQYSWKKQKQVLQKSRWKY